MSDDLTTLDKFIQGTLALAFTLWAWVVRNFGKQHLDSLKDIRTDIKDLRAVEDKNSQRISKLEGRLGSEE